MCMCVQVCVRARLSIYACVVVAVVAIMIVAALIGCQGTQSSNTVDVVLFWQMWENQGAIIGPCEKPNLSKKHNLGM